MKLLPARSRWLFEKDEKSKELEGRKEEEEVRTQEVGEPVPRGQELEF